MRGRVSLIKWSRREAYECRDGDDARRERELHRGLNQAIRLMHASDGITHGRMLGSFYSFTRQIS